MGSKFPVGRDPQDNPFYPEEPQVVQRIQHCIVCNARHAFRLTRIGDDLIWKSDGVCRSNRA